MGEDLVEERYFNKPAAKGRLRGPGQECCGSGCAGATPGNEAGMCPGINDLTNSPPIADWVGEES